MLRNSNFRLKSTPEIIEKIDTILRSQSKRSFKSQLMFIKGFFVWTDDLADNPEEALNLWLNAIQEATDLEINVRIFNLLQSINQIDFIIPLFSTFLFLVCRAGYTQFLLYKRRKS